MDDWDIEGDILDEAIKLGRFPESTRHVATEDLDLTDQLDQQLFMATVLQIMTTGEGASLVDAVAKVVEASRKSAE